MFYRARYYDPAVGRFTQRDPIGLRGGMNPYAYTDNRPVNLIDPTGNCPMCVGAGTSVLVGGVIRYLGSGGDWNSVFDAKAIAFDAAIGALGTGIISKGLDIVQRSRNNIPSGVIQIANTKTKRTRKQNELSVLELYQ